MLMKRRKAIKALAVGTTAPAALLSGRSDKITATLAADFTSDWQAWPDMPWVGPAYWGNSLQDWQIAQGKVQCNVRAPNRTLHCLTHQLSSRAQPFATQVTVALHKPSGGLSGQPLRRLENRGEGAFRRLPLRRCVW